MDKNNKAMAIIEGGIFLGGLFLIFATNDIIPFVPNSNFDKLIDDIGTSLVAASIVSFVARITKLNHYFSITIGFIAAVLANNIFGFYKLFGYTGEVNSTINKLLVNSGMGFLVASLFYLMQKNLVEETADVKIISNSTKKINESYKNSKRKAENAIDVIGVTLNSSLVDFADDKKIRERLINKNIKTRVLILSPDSKYVEDLATERGITIDELKENIKKSISKIFTLSKYFERQISNLEAELTQGFHETRLKPATHLNTP